MEDKELETVVTDMGQVAQSVRDYIKYEMTKDLLLKPLAPLMITKVVSVPVPKDEAKDEDGNAILDYDNVEEKEVEVESSFRQGIVLKVPKGHENEFSIGETVVYHVRSQAYFELMKDTVVVKPWDVVAKKI